MKKTISVLILVLSVLTAVFAHPIYEQKSIRIFSTSDTHGKFIGYDYPSDSVSTSGSLAQISTLVKENRTENTILVDVGDTIQGNSSIMFFDGDPVHPSIRAMNLMGYDAVVPGNHDFNYGIGMFQKQFSQLECPVICANVYYEDGSRIGLPYIIIERSGVKVGIIGTVTYLIEVWDAKIFEEAHMKVTVPLDEIKELAKELRPQVDVLVLATHMDCDIELKFPHTGTHEIAEQVPELDIILEGHGHKAINEYINGVLIVENKIQGKTVCCVDVDLEYGPDGKYHIVKKTGTVFETAEYAEDPAIVNDSVIAASHQQTVSDLNAVIFRLTNDYLAPPNRYEGMSEARLVDTALSRLINDAQKYFAKSQLSACSVVEDNANLYKGDIKRSDMILVYRYDNSLSKIQITGNQIRKYIEWCANYFDTFEKGDTSVAENPEIINLAYDIFSGLKYEIDISKPFGERVGEITLLDGTPLDPDGQYTMAVSTYRYTTHLMTYGIIFSEEDGLPVLLETGIGDDIGGIREMIAEYIVKVIGKPCADGTIELTLEEVTPENANWRVIGY